MNDAILGKIEIIKQCLRRIDGTTSGDPQKLQNYDTQDIFVLNLQRAVQAAIDAACIIIADNNWHMPSTYKELFEVLNKRQIINTALAENLQAMVGFRNIVVHDYQKFNILKSILTDRLIDLQEYYQSILSVEKVKEEDENI